MLNGARYGSNDLVKAKAFYDEIAKIVGAQRVFERPDVIAYKGPEGGIFLIGKPFEGEATHGNGTQVTLAAQSRAIVDAVYAKALELGGKSEGAPGIRGDDPNGFYGAYFRDLDGNKLVAFRFGPPD
jgi:hypothetical protein